MIKVNFSKNIYLYGKVWDIFNKKEDENKKNCFVIYTTNNISIFDKIPLSSLEGYFISDESHLDSQHRLSWDTPQVIISRGNMKSIEKDYLGKFIPFER